MAVLEVLRALASAGVLVRGGDGRWAAALPDGEAVARVREASVAGQRRSIAVRAATQHPAARQLLQLLALLGRETAARVLTDAGGLAAGEVLTHLDRLAAAGLVRLGERGWAPAHDLIGEAVAADLGPAERGRSHALLAAALARAGADRAEVARHLAGAGDAQAAAEAYAAAADERLAAFAHQEAHQLADTGLALAPTAAVGATLLEHRAEARARAGDLAGAADDLRAALAAGLPRPARARLLARHARLAVGAEDLALAAELVQLALAETAGDDGARAAVLHAGAIIDMNTDRPQRARERGDEALALFERVGDARGVADILDARAMATCLDGRNREAIAAFDRVARLFLDTGDLLRVVTPRSTRGHMLTFLGRPGAALQDAEQALELARTLGYAEGISYALWHVSEALSALGRVGPAEEAAREAIAVARRVGHRSWTMSGHRALGIALQSGGDPAGAERAFTTSLELAEHWPLFVSWSAARIALVRLTRGDAEGAAPFVVRALAEGPPLAHYEARLAHAELAAARGEAGAREVARDAWQRAEAGGHLVAVPRLRELAEEAG
jgi:tetratricopeptide (TPR) repeat protein